MAWRNSATSWGTGSKLFHWTMALLILGSAIFILHVNDSTWWFASSPAVFIKYIHWHKAFGLMALALVIGRLLWRRGNLLPSVAPLTPFEQRASKWTHAGLYALMVIVPLTGWIASSAFGSPTKFFGLFTIPGIIPKTKELVAPGYWSHFVVSWVLLGLVAVHAAAAIYHHVRRKDAVLRAMWFSPRAGKQGEAE